MRRMIFLIALCCCFLTGKANIEDVSDSLVQALETLPRDTTRLNTLNQLIIIEQSTPDAYSMQIR